MDFNMDYVWDGVHSWVGSPLLWISHGLDGLYKRSNQLEPHRPKVAGWHSDG